MGIEYKNAKIYKIIGPDPSEACYVGSTTKRLLCQRMSDHVSKYNVIKRGVNRKKTMSFILFEKYGTANCKIILLEAVTVKSKDELRMKEQEWIDKLNCVNAQRAYTSKEDKKLMTRNWVEANKESIFHRMKVYREANKAIIKIKKKTHYIKNKITISATRKVHSTCVICNCSHRKDSFWKHNRTIKHIKNTMTFMKNTVKQYQQVKPVEIINFKLGLAH
jgi:hypothetical protein